MVTDPTTKHVCEICSAVCVWSVLSGSDAWRALGLASWLLSLAHVLFKCLPWEEGGGAGVGVWCLPSFSVIVASLYLILPGHQLLSELCLLQHKTQASLRPPPPLMLPHIHPSTGCPCGRAAVGEAKFTRLEWLQWQLCFSAHLLGPLLSGLLHRAAAANCSFDGQTSWWLTDWLDKSLEAWSRHAVMEWGGGGISHRPSGAIFNLVSFKWIKGESDTTTTTIGRDNYLVDKNILIYWCS